eukprot:TRINITY_DN1006_c0_g1_i7.p1 TRINITY_DN1006_c0_g1~~TRINITY_DN1006_c0_g1_i7.p1  ORF type:complete len:354 (+),score=81.19 TRINITY_DN1006_c0_g1_i7:239-1300(+)
MADTPDLFPAYFEIFCLAITFTIGAQATWFFGDRTVYLRVNAMNLTGLASAFIAFGYTLVKLLHLFVGWGANACTGLRIALGLGQGMSNGFAFLHLFLRADAINTINPCWPPYRAFGILLTVTNWIVFIVVTFKRTGGAEDQFGAQRCVFKFEETTNDLKWILQFINHIVFTSMFVYPLVRHMRAMERANLSASNSSAASRGTAIYKRLVRRAVIPMTVSTLFTLVVMIMVFVDYSNPTLEVPITSLAILDNGMTLGSICFANGGASAAWERSMNAPDPGPPVTLSSGGPALSLGDQETWPTLSPSRASQLENGSVAMVATLNDVRCSQCGLKPHRHSHGRAPRSGSGKEPSS